MSPRISLTQKSRPYKIEVYGLQDDFLGTLQSYNDTFIGQVVDPSISIQDDGSQTFSCSIPKFYIGPAYNERVQNPRWLDTGSGKLLAENTRILKVFLEINGEIQIYPFIIDKITDKRDSHFSTYREIECSGLAFAELGKIGYKLELNSHTLEMDYAEDNTTLATINYWLDKVFPNEKNADGKIVKWLTPWCYEIRMDWSSYSEERDSTKIYEDSYTSSWGVKESGSSDVADQLVSVEITEQQEKARYIDCKNSNKYNITQDIAEAFGVFCVYEYKCAENGKFYRDYIDESGNVWQGRKVVFYNKAIKTSNPLHISYQNNLQSISRTSDSSEIYSKLYITPIESSTMEDGYISIANTTVNPLLDDFILNFDYLYSIGSISDYQMNCVKNYQVGIHKDNTELRSLAPTIENLAVEINNVKAKISSLEKGISSAQEQLQTYQKLRDNEVTNTPVVKDKSNSYSVVFVSTDNNISQAQIRLQGVAAGTIVGYSNYEYTTKVFDNSDLKVVNKVSAVLEGDNNFYLVLDDYGFPSLIYTISTNPILKNGSAIIYLELVYSPKNAYEAICNSLLETISLNTAQKELLEKNLEDKDAGTGLQIDYAAAVEQQELLLKDKDGLNSWLERQLGPALREGYWTPSSYEDPGQGLEADLKIQTTWEKSGAKLIFDTEPFEDEETGYYYDSIDSINAGTKKYYDYLDISNYYTGWHNNNKIENLVIHLLNPGFSYTVVNNVLAAGKYFILYNGRRFYFTTTSSFSIGTKLEFKIENSIPVLYSNGTKVLTTSTTAVEGATNLTTLFEGINSYLGDRLIYNKAGFEFAFVSSGGSVKPVLLFNNTSIDYERYQNIGYSFGNGNVTYFTNSITKGGAALRYPRIAIYNDNVNYDSDNLTIVPHTGEVTDEDFPLEKYYDYSILLRNSKPFFTLKVTNNNDIYDILKASYKVNYQISRANEMLYLDAKEVAFENSYPKYSYEISIANIPNNISVIELGQLVYINDYSLGVSAATGYISGIKYSLNSPQNDELTIQNYKTKFEDLFSTITASSEAMKNNAAAYNIAAGSFSPNGLISGSILQDSINDNNLYFSFSETNVNMSDVDGIVLTNNTAYTNGVYGQVALRGGGIFLSNAIDASGARIWNTGITPSGINASMITTGQLDTNLIRLFAGDNIAFQWNPEGIFAYRRNENGTYDMNSYVQYSDKGLQYYIGEQASVDLGWDGLQINAQDGALSLSGSDGLTIFEGAKNEDASNHIIRLGRIFQDDGTFDYGLRLYKRDSDGNYVETLITTNNGELWLKDEITIGTKEQLEDGSYNIAGISGTLNAENQSKSVRFWAGALSENKNNAPFQVLQDGTLIASRGRIGSLTIEGIADDLSNLSIDVSISSSEGEVFTEDGIATTITTTISKDGEEVTNFNGYGFRWEKKAKDATTWTTVIDGLQSAVNVYKLTPSDYLQFRCVVTYNDKAYISNILTFRKLVIDKDNSIQYLLSTNVNTVGKGLLGYNPPSVEIVAYYNETPITYDTKTTQSAPENAAEGYKLILEIKDSSGVIISSSSADTWNFANTDEKYTILYNFSNEELSSDVATIIIQLTLNNALIAIKEIPFVLDENLKELAKIKDGQVIISEGKVYSEAIVTNAITTEKIAAAAIVADKIQIGSIQTEHLRSNSLSSTDGYTYADSTHTYTSSGCLIDLNSPGSLHFSNFYVDSSGNVGMRGTIEAKDGLIGGWTIEDYYITKLNSNKEKLVGLYSGTDFTYNNSPIRFFAGGTSSINRNFIVTEDGQLLASNANITGSIIATDGYISNKFYVGSDQGIVLNGSNGSLYSHGFAAGCGGWRILANGNAEFNNITARGKLSSVIFETNKTSAVGGSLYIAPSIILEEDTIVSANGTFEVNVDDSNNVWNIGVEALMNCTIENQVYDNINVTISGKTTSSVIVTVPSTWKNKTINAGGNIILIGDDTTKRYIYLTANNEYGPFIDVQNYSSSYSALPQVRIGNLSGIIDEYFSNSNLSGYGLYSQNAYLRGQMILPKVGISNQEAVGYDGTGIYSPITEDDTSTAVRIWAGGDQPIANGQAAPFVVTQDGYLYATRGIFSGTIQASGGFFSGSIKAAGIVVDDPKTEELESEYDHFYVGYKEGDDLTPNDYILNIDSNGLSIYENGLSVFSDLAAGWQNNILTSNIFKPYNYNDSANEFLPYFYLQDDGIVSDTGSISEINSRWISSGGHILNFAIDGNNYSYNSISFKNGIFFTKGSLPQSTTVLKNAEKNIYSNSSSQTGILLSQSGATSFLNVVGEHIGFNIKSTQSSLEEDFVFDGVLQVINTTEENNQILLNKQIIKEAFYNNGTERISCGIDIVTV